MKRAFDFIFALVGLILLSPVIAGVALIIWRTIGSPIFFCQLRPGLDGRPFTLIKFRSMRDGVGPDGQIVPDAERLMPLGRFLRDTSLDEIPELWNVLRGDMSFVGPRPLLMEYLPLYSAEQVRRHQVRPGIIGWAQVNGRNAISWPEKFALDVWYVDNQNFWLDMKIVAMTVSKVVRREGIAAQGEATMPKFKGGAES